MNPKSLPAAAHFARATLWSVISAGFVDPYHRGRLGLLAEKAFRQRCRRAMSLLSKEHGEAALGPGEMSPSEASLERLFEAYDTGYPAIESDYRKLFGLTAISVSCPPCEIEYLPSLDLTYRSQWMADLVGFYRAFGLELARSGERADHVTTETEFLHLLCLKEAHALLHREWEGAEICREARRKFYVAHSGFWLCAFAALVKKRTDSRYYRTLAEVVSAASASERIDLELPPFSSTPEPNRLLAEPTGSCFDCVRC